jgi:hypothetical protein
MSTSHNRDKMQVTPCRRTKPFVPSELSVDTE